MRAPWREQRLIELTKKITDGSHNPPKGIDASEYLMLSSKNVFDDNLHYENPRYLSSDHFYQENKRTAIEPGDVLLTIVGTIGRCAIVPSKSPSITLQRSVAVIRPLLEIVEPRFLMYCFINRSAELNELARSVAQKGIYLETLRDLVVSFPAVLEQQRIVAILDEAFDGIATAKANAEKNLQNARELFDSHLHSVFARLAQTDRLVRIDEACASIMDCVNKTAAKVDNPTPYKMIRTTNVKKGHINLESVNYVTEDVYLIWTRRQVPKRGDVILTREAPMGEVGMLLSHEKVFLGQRLVSYRGDPNKTNNYYLLYALQSPYLQNQIHALASGSTVQHMRVPDSKALKLPMPTLSVQVQVVENISSLLRATQHLESLYQQKLATLNELKKSLLHQAFSGEL